MIGRLLEALGKTDRKVVAVFARDPEQAAAQVRYVRANLELPVWLYSTCDPPAETAAACARVVVARNLFWRAQRELWPYRVALALTAWDGKPGAWPVKLAPFGIPFFRVLVRNPDGGYFPGTPAMVGRAVLLGLRRGAKDARVRCGEWALGAVLWLFAFFAQWNSALSLAVFKRVRGSKHLDLRVDAKDEGIAVHQYRGRKWNAQRIADLRGRYAFFLQEGCTADPEELLPLFHDADTFAVARQHAVRSWRKLLFATAPFRELQPGEATRVAAPVAPAMLVDLAKLRALGIPHLSSYGSNWYVLFHRAAAAGWKSFSLGGGTAGELAAVPFDEAEFVRAVIDDPELRVLTPREPLLTQGNIARSVAPGPGFRGLLRVLIVSPYLPFPLSHGGAVRIWNLCRSLADRVDFVLACFREKTDTVDYRTLHRVFREVYVLDIDEKHGDTRLPKQVNGYESQTMRELIRTTPADIVQLEYTQMAGYREAVIGRPAILVEHDLTFTLYRQLARDAAGRAEYERWLAFERERLTRFEQVWTMSELDCGRAVAEGSPAERTIAVPNGVDLAKFRCGPASAEAKRVLYVGSFRHLPNYLAFEELRNTIMPQVWRSVPEATLDVVAGPDHFAHWPGTRELDRRITVHGFVTDLVPLYEACSVAVVPLPVSAGTNIKLMEALSCERAVVSTPVGCAGLQLADGRDLLIRDLGPGFGQAVAELLLHPRPEMAANGLRQARERFSWEAIAGLAFAQYRALHPSPPSAH